MPSLKIPPALKWILSILTLFIALWLIVRFGGVSYEEVAKSLALFSWEYVLLAYALVVLQVFSQIMRLWALFQPTRPCWSIVGYVFAFGQLVNSFVPARAGDAVKIVMLNQKPAQVPIAQAAGVMLADKILDALVLLLLVAGSGAFTLPEIRQVHFAAEPWVFWLLGGIVVAVLILSRVALKKGLQRVSASILHFKQGLSGLTNAKVTGLSGFFGLVCWAAEAVAIQALCYGQGFPISFTQAAFTLFALNLALSVPITIGNVGPFEAAMLFALQLFGLNAAPALAVATAHHALQLLGIGTWVITLGIVKRFFKSAKVLSG